MMMCTRCKKRPAVVFVSGSTDAQQSQGYCLICAKELGIKPVNDLMEKMGITEEMMESMESELSGLMSMDGAMMPTDDDDDENGDENGFTQGGAATFPFLKNIFQGPNGEETTKEQEETDASSRKTDDKKKKKRKYLNMYCTNLTGKAKNGELDAIIGRDNEIARVIQILSRRTKNNPCLIGEPGVGKTAIAEGLSIRIAQGNVPARLKKKEIHLLDLTALVAGTQFRGQFESRIKGLVDEVKADGNIILFIDEVHNLVGTGDAEGSMNAANILKPALSRGEIQVIGATTFTEYRKYIEKDTALERRFQPVTVVEPSVDDTIHVLLGIKSYYENYHRVQLSDYIIKRAVVLSERYITDRFLPDKAIDLMDESCACAALRNASMAEYDTAKFELEKLKEQEEQMTADGAEPDYEKLAETRCEIARLEEKTKSLEQDALHSSVTEEDLAHVIELWTGIPASRIQESELKKLADLENKLNSKVIGQKEAVEAVAAAIRRSKVQISPRRRPASFIFVGPTGVGKTELVKVLSHELFDTPDALIRLDMSEFMEKHSVSRIIGSPPGYVGYDEAGQMTEKVRRKPYSVILFDEIGRGTATFDGMAIAQAMIEYIASEIHCMTLFSTHYHELTFLEDKGLGIQNVHASARVDNDHLVFEYLIKKGRSNKSYGVNVAKLAKLPDEVINRANLVLETLEENNVEDCLIEEKQVQVIEKESEVEKYLKTIDPMALSPLDALSTLIELKKLVK